MIAFFAAMAVATASSCPPVDGAAALFTEKTKYVWVGEVHGTAEEPALFGDLVCQAAATRPVVVALERDVAEQPLWNAYLASDGGAAARAAFLQAPSWNWEVQDGRSSQAMLGLADRLRLAKRQGAIKDVKLILAGGASAAVYEQSMAQAVLAARDADPRTLVMAFSGNLHAKRGENVGQGETYALAAKAMPVGETLLVVIRGGSGTAWNCRQECGENPRGGWSDQARRVDFTNPPEGFDAVAYTGRSSTASPPAARPAKRTVLPGG